MRHSDPSLTANVYTDPRLLDIAGAMGALPSLPLDGEQAECQKATGTLDDRPLAPTLAPDWCKRGQIRANADKTVKGRGRKDGCERVAGSAAADKRKRPLSSSDNGRQTRPST